MAVTIDEDVVDAVAVYRYKGTLQEVWVRATSCWWWTRTKLPLLFKVVVEPNAEHHANKPHHQISLVDCPGELTVESIKFALTSVVHYDPDTAMDPYAKGHYSVAVRAQEGKSKTKWKLIDDYKLDILDDLPANKSLRYAVYNAKDTTKLLKRYVGQ